MPGPDAGRGLNFGWAALEGDEPFNEDLPLREPYHPPEFITPHDSGRCALIGGSVYRGTALPELVGDYLFLDYCEARLLSLHRNEDGDYEERDLGLEFPPDSFVSMFSTTPDGEILISSLGRSTVYELVPGGGT